MTLISIIETGKVPVLLAPMAEITDLPFRNAVSKFGVDMVFSEMIADHSLLSRVVKIKRLNWAPVFTIQRCSWQGVSPQQWVRLQK